MKSTLETRIEKAEQARAAKASKVPKALDWDFLRRTGISAFVTAGLVGLCTAVYGSLELGARYLFFAAWATGFFALSGLIFKSMMFEGDRFRGLVLIAFKVAMVAAVAVVLVVWPINPETQRAHGLAMIAGISTPLLVVVLRVLGWAMDMSKRQGKSQGKNGTARSNSDAPASDASAAKSSQQLNSTPSAG